MTISDKAKDRLASGLASRKAAKEVGYALDAAQVLKVPLTSLLDPDGDPIVKFVNGASTLPGWSLTDSEAVCLRWNNDAAPGIVIGQLTLPPGLDSTYTLTFEFLCSKTGATVGDATTITVAAFILAAGSLHDADADAGGVTGALVGNAAAKTTAVLSRTIAAADIPTDARSMSFTFKPTAGTLGTDDLCVHDVRVVIAKVA